MKPLISIIIPTFNRADLISEALESIIAQTYTNWECIVIDDGSTDTTNLILSNFVKNDNRIKYFLRPENRLKGSSSCRNYGFELCLGEFVQFFDSDDIMHPKHLQYKIENIGDTGFVVCKLKEFNEFFDEKLFLIDDLELVQEEENIFEAFVTGRFQMMMVAPMWKYSILEKYMPIREDLHILEDHELYARILNENKRYKVLNINLIYYRIGLPSSTNSFYKDIGYGLDSYLEAKSTVLRLANTNEIKHAILKLTLWVFRMALAQKNYKSAEKCIDFIIDKKLCYNFKLRIAIFRITFFYFIFKLVGRGDTKFKKLLKI